MLADDMTVVREDPGESLAVVPGVPVFNLPDDAAVNLQQSTEGLMRRRGRRLKVSIPVVVAPAPAPVRALYVLQPESGSSVRREPVTGAAKFVALRDCLYGPVFQADRESLFPLEVALLARTPVYRLFRPLDRWTMDDVLTVLLQG
jgi:hypothetical protein